MKKILVRVNDLNLLKEELGNLTHVSFELLAGEITVVLGLDRSGKDVLLDFFKAHAGVDFDKCNLYVGDTRIKSQDEWNKYIHWGNPKTYDMRDWTVTEYVYLGGMKWIITKKQRKTIGELLKNDLEKEGIHIDVDSKVSELSELKKRCLDIYKAKILGKKVVIIEDEFEGMNRQCIREFAGILKGLIHDRMTVVVFSHSDVAAMELADRFMVLRSGCLVKKSVRESFSDMKQLEEYFLGNTMRKKKMELDSSSVRHREREVKDYVYGINGVLLKNDRLYSLRFREGEITTFLSLDRKLDMQLFEYLSGRLVDEEVEYSLGKRRFYPKNYLDFVREKIIAIERLGDGYTDGIFSYMSIRDNLILPSLQKITSMEYILNENGINTILSGKMDENPNYDISIKKLPLNEKIRIVLERWYMFRPRVCIFLNPFSKCDNYGVSLVKSYMVKLAESGSAIIIIKNRHEYIEDISDRIIAMDPIK